ncbi:o-succinylbenzoate synthase [Bacillus testis]|uniref:o-succinylbenzoate synthase n=1 Tax=Bacillus testis TaxID=1622072 RepID=UPI00067F47F6|nr:o-succinylbenzoate synthase [Bacillus testis]
MKLSSVTLYLISSDLKRPFHNALGMLKKREAIIVEVKDENGISGWGEVVAFSTPWYTEETIFTSLYTLKTFLIPLLKEHPHLNHPAELASLFAGVRGHHMAKSGLEGAIWDLYSRRMKQPLSIIVGGTRASIEAGIVIASDRIESALEQLKEYKAEGYKRFKLKINRKNVLSFLDAIRADHPDVPLMADANSSFTLDDLPLLRQLDQYKLLMIEQPFSYEDLADHRLLQAEIKTPVCLDESITSYNAARNAVALGSCEIISVKMGRMGGWQQALQLHSFAQEANIRLWCGGMIEFGISKAHNIALSSLPGFTLPGDFSPSEHYWEHDILTEPITVKNGEIEVSKQPGIGYEVDRYRLKQLTDYTEMISLQ